MSLIHWWPLNGNADDFGANPINGVGINNAAFAREGKTGQCLDYIKDSAGISVDTNLVSEVGSKFSACCWIYINGAHTHYNGTFISSGNWNSSTWAFGISQDNTKIDAFGGSYNKFISYPGGFSTNTWYHIASTVQDGISKVYVNGSYIGKISVSNLHSDASNLCIGRETYAGGYFGFNGKICDMRIYDDCLSAKEVKQIAQANVLEYKFDDPWVEPTINLITSITPGGQTKIQNNEVITSGANSDTYFHLIFSKSLEVGKTYSISCQAECGDATWIFGLGSQLGTDPRFIIKNGYNQYTFVATANSAKQALLLDDVSRPANQPSRFYNFQMEEKDHCTPFTINSRTGTKIFNCAGYQHTATGNALQIKKDTTARNNSFVDLKKSPSDIALSQSGELSFVKTGTITMWARYESSANYLMCLADSASTSRWVAADTGSGWYHSPSTGITNYCDGVVNNKPIKDGKWHFYAFSGIDLSTFTGIPHISAYGGNTGSSFQFHGDLSEYRIYNTILNAEEIKSLYEVGASATLNQKIIVNTVQDIGNNLCIKSTIAMTNPSNEFESIQKHSNYNTFMPSFNHGIEAYNYQHNNKVTFTSQGIHISSPPNIKYSEAGNSMYGGVGFDPLNLGKDILQTNHTYIITWRVKGQSSRSPDVDWTNNYGWGGGGLTPRPSQITYNYPGRDFKGNMLCYFKFTIEDGVWKTCTDAYSSFKTGESYISYATFYYNYSYGDTGPLGTDIYITDFQLFDITNLTKTNPSLSVNTILQALGLDENSSVENIKVYKNGLITANEFIES